MRTMTVTTRLFGVRADRANVKPLWLVVASHAARRADLEVRAETVAVLACRCVRDPDRIASVEWRRYLAVALPTQIRGWRGEPRFAVTVTTRNVGVADVDLVPGASSNRSPDLGHVLGIAHVPAVTARRDDEDQHRDPDHRGDAPVG
jgi:hypothetical protein